MLGADLRLTAYEGSGPLLRDETQATIVEELLRSRGAGWRGSVEADVPGPGRRSVDLRLDGPTDIVLIEVETRVGSLEEIVRELHAKRRAFVEAYAGRSTQAIHVVLAIPMTRHHSAMVRRHPEIIHAAFPVASADIRRAISGPARAFPGDGLLWIRRPAVAQTHAVVMPRVTKRRS